MRAMTPKKKPMAARNVPLILMSWPPRSPSRAPGAACPRGTRPCGAQDGCSPIPAAPTGQIELTLALNHFAGGFAAERGIHHGIDVAHVQAKAGQLGAIRGD